MIPVIAQTIPSPIYAGSSNIVFAVDFSGALILVNPATSIISYDHLSAAAVTISPGSITLNNVTIIAGSGGSATAVEFTASGGISGAVYTLIFTITGSSGQIPVLPVFLRCQ